MTAVSTGSAQPESAGRAIPYRRELLVGTASPERAGAASAISGTGAEFGGALGIAVLGSIGAAFYRRHGRPLPADVPTESAERRTGTTDGGQGGLAPARPPRSALLEAADAAFSCGLRVASVVSTFVVARARGRPRPAAQEPGGPRRRAGSQDPPDEAAINPERATREVCDTTSHWRDPHPGGSRANSRGPLRTTETSGACRWKFDRPLVRHASRVRAKAVGLPSNVGLVGSPVWTVSASRLYALYIVGQG
jgi:hypothetical protein